MAMRQRCNDTHTKVWKYYGGRGIKVCEEWDDFWKFATSVGERPEGKSLDRIDNDGNYEPGNVRWATASEQMSNRRPMIYAVPAKCRNGHDYIVVMNSAGHRQCAQCKREHDRERSLAFWEKQKRERKHG